MVGAAVTVPATTMYADTRPGGCDDAIDVLREAGLLEQAIADGYVSQEALAREGLSSDGSPQAPSTPAETPSSDSE